MPKYAPPTATANITSNGLSFKEPPTIFGFMIFASICCKIITITSIQIACANPPVTRVIIAEIATANIAPKYGIRLNNPIKNPNNTEYFTPNKDIAIDVNIPITIPSNT